MHGNFIAFKGFCPKYINNICDCCGEDMHGWEKLWRSKEHGQKSHSLRDKSFSKLLV